MFPLYKDKNTVELMIKKSSRILKKLKRKHEIIIFQKKVLKVLNIYVEINLEFRAYERKFKY